MTASVGIVVPTYNSCHHLEKCLKPLMQSSLTPRILVIDSSSQDGTVDEAKKMGLETLTIRQKHFNHGLTRELARKHLETDIVVMVTPDAYATGIDSLDRLVQPVQSGRASLAYGRQLPRPGSGEIEAFLRLFNYPDQSHIRGMEDAALYGVYLCFCSNSFAAWSQKALDEVGGFRATLTAEDTFAAARLLRAGHQIAYVAEATVHHSHCYSLKQEFQRYFDTGYVRNQQQELIDFGAADSGRGKQFSKELTHYVWAKRPWMLPYVWANLMAKWLGYQIGRRGSKLSTSLAQSLSAQPYYWQSIAYEGA